MSAATQSLTVRVPLAIRQRGGRKLVVTPEGEATRASALPRTRVDSTLVKALARAYRWKRLLENGTYASITELAKAEKIDRGYLGRILLLTLLALDIVEAILDGRQPAELGLPRLMKPFPLNWTEQRACFLGPLEHRLRPFAARAGRRGVGLQCFANPGRIAVIPGGFDQSPFLGFQRAKFHIFSE